MKKITVGLASCGISAGGDKVYETLEELIKKNPKENIKLQKTGCIGACFQEVLVDVEDSAGKLTYCKVTPEKAEEIFQKHLIEGKPINEFIFVDNEVCVDTNLFSKQRRIVLRNTGRIDPENIDDYTEKKGFDAFHKVLCSMTPLEVCDSVKKSGLRGRGGAGFSTGLKFELTAREKSDLKYMVCNADEGDPGAFMDRSILEGDPFSVIEGMCIAAYAIGASKGYIYVRAEYPLAIERLHKALDACYKKGFLGENIHGSDFSFSITIKVGAGAFVCGEETSLIASIEGKRGMPKLRPPYPAQKGINDKPTMINNVETLANIPYIISQGWESYADIGTESSKGTKVFALAGKIKHSGLVEVPMGITIREIIYDIGGGIKNEGKLKAVQFGGPSGGCVPEDLIDTPVDYESLKKSGAIMGSGGMIVMDETTCMVDVAKFFMSFICNESCGKCTYCRIGTKRMYEILEGITGGKGTLEDIDRLYALASQIKDASLCGLGHTAPNPVLTTLEFFKDEYESHINDKRCPAKVCTALLLFTIDPEACTGCTICAKKCPVDAITGTPKELHTIDQELCIKCDQCRRVCKFDAVRVQ